MIVEKIGLFKRYFAVVSIIIAGLENDMSYKYFN